MNTNTLVALLASRSNLDTMGITFIEGGDTAVFVSYTELYHKSLNCLGGLQYAGVRQGDELVFQIDENKDFIVLFWACILGGIIPVPLTVGQTEDHKRKLFNVWSVLQNPRIVFSSKGEEKLQQFVADFDLAHLWKEMKEGSIALSQLFTHAEQGIIASVTEEDIAFIQFSSGSTGQPKGVILTHKNLLTNVAAISKAAAYEQHDSMMSWMPLTHDMGLIGFHINPLYCGMNQYIMPTSLFVRRPSLWLSKADQHRVSILCSPNFGYRYVLKYFDSEAAAVWDLSCVRIIYNGAEPISEKLCREFLEHTSAYGIRRGVIRPVYGLAEASLAVSMSNLDEDVRAIGVQRAGLLVGEKISTKGDPEMLSNFVEVGKAIDNCQVRIVDDADASLLADYVGHIQISGASVTTGYYHNNNATAAAYTTDGWLRTGDIGFIHDDSLFVTGRAKDILLINGQNFYSHDIEQLAEQVEGIELNKIVVAGFFDHQVQKEQCVAFVFHRGEIEKFVPIAQALQAHIRTQGGLNLDTVIPVKDIPRTTSGKLQRFKLVEQYQSGYFETVTNEVAFLMSVNNNHQDESAVAPEEMRLLNLIKDLVKVPSLGLMDNLVEAGLDSLKSAELSMYILKEFGVELQAATIYEHPTIKQLASAVMQGNAALYVPIERHSGKSQFPLSAAQRGVYYAHETNSDSTAYNLPVAFRFTGILNIQRLEVCLKQLVGRHEALRTSFYNPLNPVGNVHDSVDCSLVVLKTEGQDVGALLQKLNKPFTISEAPLFRFHLLVEHETSHILFLNIHHLITDGVSISNFMAELSSLYAGSDLEDSGIQYGDFSLWEQHYLDSTVEMKESEGYWRSTLGQEIPTLEIPTEFERPVVFDTTGQKIEFELEEHLTSQLRKLSTQHGQTLHALVCTAYAIFLSNYTGENEVVFGIPVTVRNHPDLQKAHGLFVNNLLIKTKIGSNKTFVQLLREVSLSVQGALMHKSYPFESLLKQYGSKRDTSRNPLFDTALIFQNMALPDFKDSEIEVSRVFFDPGISKYDFSFEFFEEGNILRGGLEYSTRLFSKEIALTLIHAFKNTLAAIAKNSHVLVEDISLLNEREYQQQVVEFNNTGEPESYDGTVVDWFCEQTKRSPKAIALECENSVMTYEELHARSNLLASVLKKTGQLENYGVVALVLDRSPEFIISVVGVLKSGKAFLPIDPELPSSRIEFILKDSQCKTVITSSLHFSFVKETNVSGSTIVVIDQLPLHETIEENVSTISDCSSSDLAYILYTSGTTGKPKGVLIEHRSLSNYIGWAVKNYCSSGIGNFPLFTSISFDLTLTSVFIPLVTGKSVVIYGNDANDVLIEKVVRENKVDIVKVTPSHLRLLVRSGIKPLAGISRIKAFIIGGENLETQLATSVVGLFGDEVTLFNEYGPTEATVGCMIHAFTPSSKTTSVPIGVPAANVSIYILDKHQKPVATNVHGELYISGNCLARGYMNNEALMHEKFIENPFVPGTKMYKTGDVAKRLADGSIVYMGRLDNQVKINGYRIELSEIESQLNSHTAIRSAIVAVKTDVHSAKTLCAYCIFEEGQAIDEAEFRQYLSKRLPHYMMPVHFVSITNIPLTSNGKIDYKALPEPSSYLQLKETNAQLTNTEEALLRVWREVFENHEIKVTDNFFNLGGDSIKAVQMVSRLSNEGFTLTTKDILTFQTIQLISGEVTTQSVTAAYNQGTLEGSRDFTPIETWFFNQKLKNSNYYNQSALFDICQPLNKGLLEQALETLINHHDGLRMNVDCNKEKVFYNPVHHGKPVGIEYIFVQEGETIPEICDHVRTQFNLQESLLIKAAIIKAVDAKEQLFITAHHLIMDGVSWRILIRDLVKIYTSLIDKKPVRVSRKTGSCVELIEDFKSIINSGVIDNEVNYWTEVVSTPFNIPQEFTGTDWRVRNTQKISRKLDREATDRLVYNGRHVLHADVNTVLNAVLALTIRDLTGSSTVVIEQENHGRGFTKTDLSNTVGWFTSMYPLKLVIPDVSLNEVVEIVSSRMNSINDFGIGYWLGMYSRKLPSKTEPSEVRMNYLGHFGQEMENEFLQMADVETGNDSDLENRVSAKFEINCLVIKGEFRWELSYNGLAYSKAFVEQWSNLFFNYLDAVLDTVHQQNQSNLHPSHFEAVLSGDDLKELFG